MEHYPDKRCYKCGELVGGWQWITGQHKCNPDKIAIASDAVLGEVSKYVE